MTVIPDKRIFIAICVQFQFAIKSKLHQFFVKHDTLRYQFQRLRCLRPRSHQRHSDIIVTVRVGIFSLCRYIHVVIRCYYIIILDYSQCKHNDITPFLCRYVDAVLLLLCHYIRMFTLHDITTYSLHTSLCLCRFVDSVNLA